MKQIDITEFQTEPEIYSFGSDKAARELEQAKQAGLKYIAARMHTRREVNEYLQKKGYAADVIADVLRFLDEYGYLDDAAYCKSWIHDRIQFHPCGRQKMAFELAKKISDKALIQESLEEYFPEEMEEELAVALAVKKIASGRNPVKREQLGRFLYTKGFGGSVVSRVLQNEEIRETLEKRYALEDDF